MDQEYRLVKVMEDEKCICRVYSPIITEEERARRMKEIYKAAERLLKKVYENEARKKANLRTT